MSEISHLPGGFTSPHEGPMGLATSLCGVDRHEDGEGRVAVKTSHGRVLSEYMGFRDNYGTRLLCSYASGGRKAITMIGCVGRRKLRYPGKAGKGGGQCHSLYRWIGDRNLRVTPLKNSQQISTRDAASPARTFERQLCPELAW